MALNLDGLASLTPAARTGRRKSHPVHILDTAWSQRGFASTIDQFGVVSITDPTGHILHVNDEFLRVSEYSRSELLGLSHAILSSSHHPAEFWAEAYRTLAGGHSWRAEVKNRRKSGRFYWVDALIVPLRSRNSLKGFLSVQRDITDVIELRSKLDASAALIRTLVEAFPGDVAAFDNDHNLILSNRRQQALLGEREQHGTISQFKAEDFYRAQASASGYDIDEIDEYIRKHLSIINSPNSQVIGHRHPNGSHREMRYIPLAHGGYVTIQTDITGCEAKPETTDSSRRPATLNVLTDSALLLDRVRALVTARGPELFAVHRIRLDDQTPLKDGLDNATSNTAIEHSLQRMGSIAGNEDIVSRLGNNDFAVVQTAPQTINDVEAMARRIVTELSEPLTVESESHPVSASVGIAVAPADGTSAEELIANAEAALGRTKSSARGGYEFFEPSIHDSFNGRLHMETELREALAANAFELHYQPIVNIKTRSIVGCEALIRWQHPERGLILASEFIPIAEECGIIGQIGDWVLKTACSEASRWPDDVWVAVNISAAQFSGANLVDKVLAATKRLPSSRLILEITELLLMKDRDSAAATLERLKKLGVRFAIDDFGTGFSSLSYLQSFPFDKIKIDRSFVSNTANQKRSATLRRSIIQLGYNLGMTSVAEGVESKQQLDLLRTEGCIEAQGFLFSPAVPAEKLRELFSHPL